MASNASLYGSRPSKLSKSELTTSSSNLAFTSTLGALLSRTKPQITTSARARPSKTKEDIFTTHNKNSKKRALADLSSENGSAFDQRHSSTAEEVDQSTLHRSKRRMEDKARLYAAMKRGDYVPTSGSSAHDPLVDFDRKWAEDEAAGREANYETSSDDGGDSEDESKDVVEFEDEFGRKRLGTKADAQHEERRRQRIKHAEREAQDFSARPSRPDGLIYGDAVQSAAFNPDVTISEQMESLAKRRDRSLTPPEEVHYDASKEVRSKGVGFYAFSKDKEGREQEMRDLEAERKETERRKGEREIEKERRKKEVEERRRVVEAKRGKVQADRFLAGLGDFIREGRDGGGEK